jgi:hypothetical protein
MMIGATTAMLVLWGNLHQDERFIFWEEQLKEPDPWCNWAPEWTLNLSPSRFLWKNKMASLPNLLLVKSSVLHPKSQSIWCVVSAQISENS